MYSENQNDEELKLDQILDNSTFEEDMKNAFENTSIPINIYEGTELNHYSQDKSKFASTNKKLTLVSDDEDEGSL